MRSMHFFDVCICKSFRYLQNRKTINELPESMKNLQRKAWREATRRHRAKKMAQAAFSAPSMSQTPSLWPGLFFIFFYLRLCALWAKCAHFVYVYLWLTVYLSWMKIDTCVLTNQMYYNYVYGCVGPVHIKTKVCFRYIRYKIAQIN